VVTVDGELPRTVAVGERFEFDPLSPCGGRLHPSALDLELRRDGETSIVGTVTVDPMFQGPPGRVHGGVVALILDEVMGSLNRVTGQRAFTARLALDLRAPAPVGAPLTFRAWLLGKRGRKITVAADGRTEEAGVFVEAEGLFVESDLPAQ
jgi:acyl-coenzyme A thioesterase PaaI-like protein